MRFDRNPVLHYSLAISFAIAVAGCGSGDPDAIKTVVASGTVSFNDKPIEQGTIGFIPGKGRPAIGQIKDGAFTLTTYDYGDGAIPGKHRVTVTSVKKEPSPTGGDDTTVFLIPQRFSIATESNVDVEVPPEGNSKIEIKLEERVKRPR